MPIATVSSTELDWVSVALRIQSEFNKEASPLGLAAVASPNFNGGCANSFMSLYKGINASLAASGYPKLKAPSSGLVTAGWVYLAKDVVSQANTALTYKPQAAKTSTKSATKAVAKD